MHAFDIRKRRLSDHFTDSGLLERVKPFDHRHRRQFTNCPAVKPQVAPSDVRFTFTMRRRNSAGRVRDFP